MSRGDITMQTLETILFKTEESKEIQELNAEQQLKLSQYKVGYVFWFSHPEYAEKQVSEYLRVQFPELNFWTANYMVQAIKRFLGDVRVANKEWQRYMLVETAKRMLAVAEAQNDVKGMGIALNLIGKYTKLDKTEADEIPFDLIVPANFEPSSDISVVSEKLKIENITEKRNKLREKYKKSFDIEDVEEIEE